MGQIEAAGGELSLNFQVGVGLPTLVTSLVM